MIAMSIDEELSIALGIRTLTPDNSKIFKGVFNLLHVHIDPDDDGPGLYRAIHAVRTFPVSSPETHISLRHTDEDSVECEVGVIVDLSVFPMEAQTLVRASLDQHYFEYRITQIYRIDWKFNLLFFDVETDQGHTEFEMRWQVDRAQHYGENGMLLMDVFDNRYMIPDMDQLSRGDRKQLTRYIYW